MLGGMMSYPLTITPLIERAGRVFGSREIVSRMPDKSLHRTTLADFSRRSLALAEALTAAGLERGDRVATLMWNHAWHLEAYFGIPAAGGVLHTLNLRLHPDDIAFIVNHAKDRFLIVDDVLLPLFEQFRDQVSFERVFVVRLDGRSLPEGMTPYEELIESASGDFTPPELDENEAAGMCYTSGTTGKPKGVVYSHRATILHSFAAALPDCLSISQRDAIVPVVPMFHANAWGVPYAAVMTGAKLVFPGPHLDPESLLDLFASENVTMSAGVPTIWLGILSTYNKSPERWELQPGLRMVVGGSAAAESMIRGMDANGWTLIHAWGMTELTPLGTVCFVTSELSTLSEDEQYAIRAKQGIPAPFVDVRVMGEDGEAPWDGQTMGELQCRGPWVAGSYHDMEATGESADDKWTADGWFRTGDVVTIDELGYVKITDRTKDLIKSGGEWISSVDLENAIMGHPEVREAAVIAVAHPKWAERPLAAVVLEEGSKVTAEDIQSFVAERFAKFWVPDAVVFIDEIPRTSTGKFLKTALRERFKDYEW